MSHKSVVPVHNACRFNSVSATLLFLYILTWTNASVEAGGLNLGEVCLSWTYGRYASVEPRGGLHELDLPQVCIS